MKNIFASNIYNKDTYAKNAFFAIDVCIKNICLKGICMEGAYRKNTCIRDIIAVEYSKIYLHFFLILKKKLFSISQ